MKIVISKDKYLEDIKQEFNKAFPYLKIDFRMPESYANKTIRKTTPLTELKVSDILKDHPEGVITIEETHSIKEIVQKFADNFGLNTYFFRKSGNLWLEIKLTKDWTLKQQNESGMEIY